MSLVGFKAKNHPQQAIRDTVDDRRTLPEEFDPLHREHGFTVDVAASDENAKLPRYFTKAIDGLLQSWANEVAWCNPPYSDLYAWVTKAIGEVFLGDCRKVVMLLPANRLEQAWWQELIEPLRDCDAGISTRFLARRRRFGHPANWIKPKKGDRPPFGLVVVVMEAA